MPRVAILLALGLLGCASPATGPSSGPAAVRGENIVVENATADQLAYVAIGEALAALADPNPFLEAGAYESHSIAAGETQPLNGAERYETGGGLVLYVYRAAEPGMRAALVDVVVVSAAELAGSGGRVVLSPDA